MYSKITLKDVLDDPKLKAIDVKRKRLIELINAIIPHASQIEKEFGCKIGFIKEPLL